MVIFHSYVKLPEGTFRLPKGCRSISSGESWTPVLPWMGDAGSTWDHVFWAKVEGLWTNLSVMRFYGFRFT